MKHYKRTLLNISLGIIITILGIVLLTKILGKSPFSWLEQRTPCDINISDETNHHILDSRYANILINRNFNRGQIQLPKKFYFSDAKIRNVAQGATGIRLHFGLDNSGLTLLLTGAITANGEHNDINLSNKVFRSENGEHVANARQMTSDYQSRIMSFNQFPIKSGYFPITAINNLLEQPNCAGLNCYIVLNNDSNLALVAYTAYQDIAGNSHNLTDGIAIDMSIPCPRDCGNSNILNNEP